jgi:hypothetical protein
VNLIKLFTGEVQCEQPNNSLYTFTGNLIVDKQTIPLSPNQLLLRVIFFFVYVHVKKKLRGGGSLSAAVKLLPFDHDAMGSNAGNSLLQKCRERLHT